jgi:hypothetical protein
MSTPTNEPFRMHKLPRQNGTVISLMRLEQEKRRQYRVQQAAMPTLHATVPFTDGTHRLGRCQDVCAGGAGVRFTKDQDPGLETGQELVLVFETPSFEGNLPISARVLAKRDLDLTSVRYTFVFTNLEEVKLHAVGQWGRWFNRRRFRRLSVDAASPVPAQIRWTRGLIDGRVVDVSMCGLGIAIPLSRSSELEGVGQVFLSVLLADNIGELRLSAIMRSETKGLQISRIGFELVRDAAFEKAAPILQRWMEKTVTRRSANRSLSP